MRGVTVSDAAAADADRSVLPVIVIIATRERPESLKRSHTAVLDGEKRPTNLVFADPSRPAVRDLATGRSGPPRHP
jgi:hypothetical protein